MRDPVRQFKADFFRALGHPARLKILELLRDGEQSVTALQTRLEVEPAGVSQQLAVLRTRNIVEARKEGTTVYYRVRDPEVFVLLDGARKIFNNHLMDTQAVLEQMNREQSPTTPKRRAVRPASASTR